MRDRRLVFGYPPIVRFAPIAMLLIMVGGFLTFTEDGRAVFLAAGGVALATALVLRRRVEMGVNEIAFIDFLAVRRYRRDEIAAVTWEPGARVVLELRTGGRVPLPSLSDREADMSAAIHGWLRNSR